MINSSRPFGLMTMGVLHEPDQFGFSPGVAALS
jgi:hypothetical protein